MRNTLKNNTHNIIMNFQKIDLDETHIRLKTDLENNDLNEYIFKIRYDLKSYIKKNQDFLLSIEPLDEYDEDLPLIVKTMYESSNISGVGPMACVAGTISELSLNYLIKNGSAYSVVENGGDIALINDKKVLCGIYSNNEILGNNIAFEIKKRKSPLGICTSSGKIGHSISFGVADSVTIIAEKSSIADGLATRIANEVKGQTSEDKVTSALECGENYKEFFESALIICENHVATIGKIPKIVESEEYQIIL